MRDVDLRAFVALAEEMGQYRGYLGMTEKAELKEHQRKFDQMRRVLVHNLRKQYGTLGLHRSMVETALASIARQNEFPGEAVEYARTELSIHLAKEHQRGLIARYVVRWAVPTLGFIAAIAYFLFNFFPELHRLFL